VNDLPISSSKSLPTSIDFPFFNLSAHSPVKQFLFNEWHAHQANLYQLQPSRSLSSRPPKHFPLLNRDIEKSYSEQVHDLKGRKKEQYALHELKRQQWNDRRKIDNVTVINKQ
jgi:hypothetical protein